MGPQGTLIPAFPPACRRKGRLMDLVRACDELFHLPVEENPPVCRRKGRLMDLVCACDGLSPLPVEEKAVSWIGARLGCGWAGLAWAWLDPWRLPWQFKADQGS